MKIKIFTLLAAIFLLSNISWGQVGEYRVRKIETITKKIEKPKKPKVIREDNPKREGFFVIPEVGVAGLDFKDELFVLSLQGIFGYEFNNHLAFGVGTGLIYSDYSYIPLYISLRGDITKKQIAKGITPYYSIDFGYNVSLENPYQSFVWKMTYNQGILFSPEIGIRTNKFYIGTEFMITKHHTYYISGRHYIESNLVLSIKLGYKIPLNNIQKFW